jgi:hypothetical protein
MRTRLSGVAPYYGDDPTGHRGSYPRIDQVAELNPCGSAETPEPDVFAIESISSRLAA